MIGERERKVISNVHIHNNTKSLIDTGSMRLFIFVFHFNITIIQMIEAYEVLLNQWGYQENADHQYLKIQKTFSRVFSLIHLLIMIVKAVPSYHRIISFFLFSFSLAHLAHQIGSIYFWFRFFSLSLNHPDHLVDQGSRLWSTRYTVNIFCTNFCFYQTSGNLKKTERDRERERKKVAEKWTHQPWKKVFFQLKRSSLK